MKEIVIGFAVFIGGLVFIKMMGKLAEWLMGPDPDGDTYGMGCGLIILISFALAFFYAIGAVILGK